MLTLFACAFAADGYVVHEWGTFTTVAGPDGTPLPWKPLDGPSELPAFVYSLEHPGLRDTPGPQRGKGVPHHVRMETPVLYFYADAPLEVEVSVGFPMGQVTEWYPRARSVTDGIDWGRVRIDPDDHAPLPGDAPENHYHAARNVAAATVRVCGTSDEHERFLFYRGVGDFPVAVTARLQDDRVLLGGLPEGEAIVFENRDGQVGHALVEGPVASVPRPSGGTVDEVVEDLERLLLAHGLRADEARAMTDTWRSSWFEEGLRVFYLVPEPEIDTLLPLTLTPAPREVARAFVGRVEVLTPEMRADVLALAAAHPEDPLGSVRERYGRFGDVALEWR